MKERNEPLIFKAHPLLKENVPWIPLLNNVPTPIERLKNLEEFLNLSKGEIYIKRDDKSHDIYGGNKLRKFEFIFANALKKKKKGIATIGGIGTNHGLACAIITKQLGLKCHLFLFPQPLTWHVQRSLLLYHYFGAKLHHSKSNLGILLKLIVFQLTHPRIYFMLPGGTPFLGMGTTLGTLGFINAVFELKNHIDSGQLPEPDAIFIALGTTGTAAGLIAGCKLLKLKTKIYCVSISMDWIANAQTTASNANKAIKNLRKYDKSIPDVAITEDDFVLIEGYRGSEYGVKTKRSQFAVDKTFELEGEKKQFKLETTYTGKAMASLFDYFSKDENKKKKVLFWNTYNSNNLDHYLIETNFDFKMLPKVFHQYFIKKFQCWQAIECPEEKRKDCPAYLNQEYRFWKIAKCSLGEGGEARAKEEISKAIVLEDS